jgi:hypothetical protein
MRDKSGKKDLPQIFVGGEYRGYDGLTRLCDEIDEANEFGEVKKWLGLE